MPLWCAHYLPFTDLPEHVAAMATLANLARGHAPDASIYVVAWSRCQYLLAHGAGGLLTLLVGDAVLANRLLLSAVALGFPISVRHALRALDRDEDLAILATLPFLSRPLFLGFLPYVASMPLYFFGVALVVRHARAPSPWRAAGLALFALALLFVHASTTTVFLGTAAAIELVVAAQAGGPSGALAKRTLRACVWLVPAAGAIAAWWLSGSVLAHPESLAGPGDVGTMSFLRSLRALPLWTFDVLNTHLDEICGLAWWAAVAAFAVLGVRRDEPSAETERGLAGLLARVDPAVVPLAVLLAAYVLTPFRVGAGGMLNVRLAPLVALAATLTLPRRVARGKRWVLGIAAVATVAHVANVGQAVRAIAARETAGLDEVLAAMRPGSRVVSLQFDPRRSQVHVDPYPFVASYHRARGGGIASYSFTDLWHWPLQYRPEVAPPKKQGLWIYRPCLFRNAVDGDAYDYVLVGSARSDPFAATPEGPAWRVARRAGSFVLYERDGDARWTGPDMGPC